VDVVGLDPDPKALARAKRKAERAGLSIPLDQGFADELPYENASFDRVFSTFMVSPRSNGQKGKGVKRGPPGADARGLFSHA
jgi:ubiquinone/menaquinone biosynthesis C-methylase UbiE